MGGGKAAVGVDNFGNQQADIFQTVNIQIARVDGANNLQQPLNMPGKVLPEVRIFSDLAQGIAERRIDLPVQGDELFHHRPRGPGGNVAIGRQQPFKGIGEIDNMLFAGAPVVRAKMVIANKGDDGLEGR
jgi:hypothetical protein